LRPVVAVPLMLEGELERFKRAIRQNCFLELVIVRPINTSLLQLQVRQPPLLPFYEQVNFPRCSRKRKRLTLELADLTLLHNHVRYDFAALLVYQLLNGPQLRVHCVGFIEGW
jgi:hypothetical protein